MTDFEKYVASSEARKTTHGEHVDKLTGYFLAETNRMREHHKHETEPAETPEPTPEPPTKHVPWWRRWGRR